MASAMAFTKPSEPLWAALVALLSICLIASANYTINEFLDAQFDRHHPLKNGRPGALGVLDLRLVTLQYLLLAAAGIGAGADDQCAFSSDVIGFVDDGDALQYPACTYQRLSLRRRSLRIDQQSHSISARLVCGQCVRIAAIERSTRLLDGRRLSDGDQALLRVSLDRRPQTSRTLSQVIRDIFRELSIVVCFFYALCAAFFIGVFLIKYKVEFVLTFPLFAALFTWYLSIGSKPNSAAQAPETLYRESHFLGFAAALFAVSIFVFYLDLPMLKTLIDTNLIPIVH